MADLAVGDVTITLQTAQPHNPWHQGVKRVADVKITFGDGALTYPTNGVPAPTYEKYGLRRNVESIHIYDQANTALLVTYDQELHTFRLFNAGAELAGGVDAPPAQEFFAHVWGW